MTQDTGAREPIAHAGTTAISLSVARVSSAPPMRQRATTFGVLAPMLLLVAPLGNTLRPFSVVFLALAACLVAAIVLFAATISPPDATTWVRGTIGKGTFTTRSNRRPRAAAWSMLGVGVLALTVSIGAPIALGVTPDGGALMTLVGVPLAIFACAIWVIIRSSRTVDITLNATGLAWTTGRANTRSVAWDDIQPPTSTDTDFSVVGRDGQVTHLAVGWLESDPYLVAELAAHCVSVPAARERLGAGLLDDLVASRSR